MATIQCRYSVPLVTDHALIFSTWQFIQHHSGTAAVAFPSRPRRALLARDLVIWQAVGIRHILENNVRRITEYLDERCLDDKWYLGNLRAKTAQLPLKCCPRVFEPSQYLAKRIEVIMCSNKSLSQL